MKTAYRTLLLRYDLQLQPEVVEKIPMLLKVQEDFRRWVSEWTKSCGSLPPPEHNPLKYFALRFLYASSALYWFKGLKKNGIKVKKVQMPLIFDTQLRLNKERDIGRGVFVDLSKTEIRIRRWGGGTVVLPLTEKAIEWILARVHEGGKLVMAVVWIGASRRNNVAGLYVALVFRREAAPMKAKRLLVVDLNALHNGLTWAVVEGERVVTKGTLRPNVSKIVHLQKVAARLESLCAKKGEACDEALAAKSRVWRILKTWEDEAARKLLQLALQYKAAILLDIPNDRTVRELKEGSYVAKKKMFLNFGRLRRRLRGLAEWYSVPLREERLYSTICPRCEKKMNVLPNRRVRCACGFEAHRDEVPAYWALRLYSQLISFSSTIGIT